MVEKEILEELRLTLTKLRDWDCTEPCHLCFFGRSIDPNQAYIPICDVLHNVLAAIDATDE